MYYNLATHIFTDFFQREIADMCNLRELPYTKTDPNFLTSATARSYWLIPQGSARKLTFFDAEYGSVQIRLRIIHPDISDLSKSCLRNLQHATNVCHTFTHFFPVSKN